MSTVPPLGPEIKGQLSRLSNLKEQKVREEQSQYISRSRVIASELGHQQAEQMKRLPCTPKEGKNKMTKPLLKIAAALTLFLAVACVGISQTPPPPKSDAPAYAEHLVQEAIIMFEAEGAEQTIAHHSSETNVDGPWFVFIANAETGRAEAHWDPDIVGRELNAATDSAGYCFGCAFLETTAEGSVVSYLNLNPETGNEEQKHAFVVRHKSYIFGAGWYEEEQ